MLNPSLNKIVIYAKNVAKMVTFYETHFGFTAYQAEGDRIVELVPQHGGASIMIHQAAKSLKTGQSAVKLVFDIKDVELFKAQCAVNGLKFGATHKADGYVYANAKDPDKNNVQISSRAYRS